ncbi:MAG TPA: carbohydrate-binding family 25 protein, partial [Clostridia bacterium]
MSILDNVLEPDAKKNKGNKRSTGLHVSKQASEKFKEEFSETLDMNDSQRYQSNGVFFTKVSDNTATLKYDGLLAQCGADDVYTV